MQPNENDEHYGEFKTSHIKRLSNKLKRRGSVSDGLSTGTNTAWNKMSKFFMSSLKDETDNPDPKKMNKRKSKAPGRIRRTHSMTGAGEAIRPSGSSRDVRRNSLYVPKSIQRKSMLKRVSNAAKS